MNHESRMSYFTHLECSWPCGRGPLDPRERHFLCACGAPLLARYDLQAARSWAKESLGDREPTLWRYCGMPALVAGAGSGSVGGGLTPLFHARAPGGPVGLASLYIEA